MSAAMHTPGPWRVAKSDELRTGDGTVCETSNGWEIRPDGEQKLGSEAADLRLIAAAPDLLEALKECAAICAGETVNKMGLIRALDMAKTALSKAQAVKP